MVHRYFTIANLLLLTAAVYFGVSIFYAVLTARLDSGIPPASSTVAEAVAGGDAPSSMADYQVIVARNLFNSGRQALAGADKAGSPGLDVDKLKQTDLKLKLWGTGVGPDGQTYAVIEDPKTREQLLYRPGDTVQKAAVKMVLRQKVVLNVDGRDEVLVMEEPGILRAAAPGPTAEAAPDHEQVALTGEQIEKALEDVGDLLCRQRGLQRQRPLHARRLLHRQLPLLLLDDRVLQPRGPDVLPDQCGRRQHGAVPGLLHAGEGCRAEGASVRPRGVGQPRHGLRTAGPADGGRTASGSVEAFIIWSSIAPHPH